jgi:hypothetical protein
MKKILVLIFGLFLLSAVWGLEEGTYTQQQLDGIDLDASILNCRHENHRFFTGNNYYGLINLGNKTFFAVKFSCLDIMKKQAMYKVYRNSFFVRFFWNDFLVCAQESGQAICAAELTQKLRTDAVQIKERIIKKAKIWQGNEQQADISGFEGLSVI